MSIADETWSFGDMFHNVGVRDKGTGDPVAFIVLDGKANAERARAYGQAIAAVPALVRALREIAAGHTLGTPEEPETYFQTNTGRVAAEALREAGVDDA